MKTITIEKDIPVFYVTATSYPMGIQESHNKLHALVPFNKERRYFGVSRPEAGKGIVYRAAAEELISNEGKTFNCETLVIKKGNYVSIEVNDFRKDVLSIGKAFETLLKHPGIDPDGYCVELYANDTEQVNCMVRVI